MSLPVKTPPRAISEKDREFEDLLRRAFNFLNRAEPSPAVTNAKKRPSKVVWVTTAPGSQGNM
jgi:hypothetical protein